VKPWKEFLAAFGAHEIAFAEFEEAARKLEVAKAAYDVKVGTWHGWLTARRERQAYLSAYDAMQAASDRCGCAYREFELMALACRLPGTDGMMLVAGSASGKVVEA
jgi:hypothetical protein